MNKVELNKDFYNKLYKKRNPIASLLYSRISFDQQSKSKLNIKLLKQHLKEKFNEPLSVLDYGFGHGSLLLKYKKQHRLYGSDISEEAVFNFPPVAKLKGLNVQTGTVDEFKTKFKDVQFDIITLSHIIEHVDDDTSLVKDLAAKLTSNGLMLINVPINEVWEDPKHVRKYDLDYTKQLLEKCNLSLKEHREEDKLTSYFLIEEHVKHAGAIKKIFIKALRFFFAIMPLGFTIWFESSFLKSHKFQQLLVLASKK